MPSTGYIADTFVAGEQPTTSKWNELWGNDASFNNGNGFNDSILLQRHFSTNSVPASALDTAAITLGYAQITSNFTTTSATTVQVTGLSVTVTIPSGGRRIKITGWATDVNSSSPGTYINTTIWDGAVGTGTQLSHAQHNVSQAQLIAQAVVTPSAGSKTYNIGLTSNGSTSALLEANTGAPAFILVEAI